MWRELLWVGRIKMAHAPLHWICQGRGYQLTSLDVQMACRLAHQAGDALDQSDRVVLRVRAMLAPTTRDVRWVRGMLSLPASPVADAS